MTELFHVSQSKAKDFRACQYKFWLKHILKIERLKKARPLKFGTIVHKMKQAIANGTDPFKELDKIELENKKLFQAEREMYGEIIEDISYIFRAYLDYTKDKKLVYKKRDGQRAEFPFEIQYGSGLLIKGTIDAVTTYRGLDWLTEHKNHKNIPNDDQRWRNVQSAVYIRVLEILDWWKVEGTCWDYIRTKPPTRPQLLQSGKMSERSIDTLPQVVIDTLKAHKKNLKDYQGLIDAATENMSSYFQRVYTPMKKKVVDTIFRDFIVTAKQMRDANLDPKRPPPRTIEQHCGWCEFEPLCRAEMQGLDTKYIMEKEYGPSTYDQEKDDEE